MYSVHTLHVAPSVQSAQFQLLHVSQYSHTPLWSLHSSQSAVLQTLQMRNDSKPVFRGGGGGGRPSPSESSDARPSFAQVVHTMHSQQTHVTGAVSSCPHSMAGRRAAILKVARVVGLQVLRV
jgi:hypothetical protein